MSESEPSLRLGVVGVGKHGARYARHAARDVPEIELVAVSRRDRDAGEAIARELDCEHVSDSRELCERSDIDALVFATPPDVLSELVPIAAASAKRIVVEKPVAVDLESGHELLECINRAGIYCVAGHTLRFNGVVRAIRERVADLGRLDSLTLSQRFPPQLQLAWLDDPKRAGGGNILHTGVHCFDLVLCLTGLEPVRVACTKHSVHTRATEDNFAATIELRSPEDGETTYANVTCSRSSPVRNGLIEISGEHGQLVGDHVLNQLRSRSRDQDHEADIDVGAPTHTVLALLERFVQDSARDAPPPVTYRDGLRAVAIARACYASCESGSFEPVAALS